MKIKILNKLKHELPAFTTELIAGMDLKVNIDKETTLEPLKRAIAGTEL
jgi:dUTP pyrophosphatase